MIIGISGRIGSGKDTVGKIIQILAQNINDDSIIINHCTDAEIKNLNWEIKKFADKLKDIVCLITGCTREQLEDQDFKKSKLNSDWNDSHGINTYRDLLQVLGTDCGRDMIHSDIWINALFADLNKNSNWIITDVRFPNELEAIKKRNGITIRVNRNSCETATLIHESETALDNANFDYKINNNGSLEDLIGKVKEILIKEKII